MNPKRFLFSILLMTSVLFSGCNASPTGTATDTPSLTPTSEIKAQHIVDLVDRGTITIRVAGGGINQLALNIQSHSDKPLRVDVPAGTFFVNSDDQSQNMVIRHSSTVLMKPFDLLDTNLDAACANLHLTEPTRADTFTVQRTPRPLELTRVIDKMNSVGVEYPVEQAAIWIVTDDATFDELGMLVEGSRFGTSIISESDAARAMMLVDQAGIPIRTRAIWEDRTKLIGKLTDPDLSAWLDDQVATQAVEQATQVVQTATAQALITPTPLPVEVKQYAKTATASSEYSATGWSANKAVGAPDATACQNDSAAWKSLSTTGKDWLLLTYDQAVKPTSIVIYQVYHPGAVTLVEVLDKDGNATTVYQAAPEIISECSDNLEIFVTDVNVLVDSLRVTIDQTGHEGRDLIDAVQLIGMSN